MKISSACIRCGLCEAVAPHLFKQHPHVVEVDSAACDKDPYWYQVARRACPVGAILDE